MFWFEKNFILHHDFVESFSRLIELQNFSHLVFLFLFSVWFVSFCNLLMCDLVDGSTFLLGILSSEFTFLFNQF